MALHVGGPEVGSNLPPELRHFRTRDIEWLENYLRRYNAPLPTFGSETHLLSRELSISDVIKGNSSSNPFISVNNVLLAHREELIPSSCLDWVEEENGRLLIWLLDRVLIDLVNPQSNARWTTKVINSEPLPIRPKIRSLDRIPSHERRAEIVRAIDFWGVAGTMKIEWLNEQKNLWGGLQRHDKRYVKWLQNFDKKSGKEHLDREQLEWALGYLNNHDKHLLVPHPTSVEETYAIVTALIDWIGHPHPHTAEKTVFIETMKKAWSQKKYRDAGKNKKPYHLPLTTDVKKQLDWLVDTTGHRATDILAALIKEEHERVKSGKRSVIDEKSGV